MAWVIIQHVCLCYWKAWIPGRGDAVKTEGQAAGYLCIWCAWGPPCDCFDMGALSVLMEVMHSTGHRMSWEQFHPETEAHTGLRPRWFPGQAGSEGWVTTLWHQGVLRAAGGGTFAAFSCESDTRPCVQLSSHQLHSSSKSVQASTCSWLHLCIESGLFWRWPLLGVVSIWGWSLEKGNTWLRVRTNELWWLILRDRGVSICVD